MTAIFPWKLKTIPPTCLGILEVHLEAFGLFVKDTCTVEQLTLLSVGIDRHISYSLNTFPNVRSFLFPLRTTACSSGHRFDTFTMKET